jgi:hypothetical protein
LLFDWWIVASEFLDPGPHPLQRGFRRMALTSSSGPHEQRLDLPKLLAQLRLAVHSDPVARSEPGSPHHRAPAASIIPTALSRAFRASQAREPVILS